MPANRGKRRIPPNPVQDAEWQLHSEQLAPEGVEPAMIHTWSAPRSLSTSLILGASAEHRSYDEGCGAHDLRSPKWGQARLGEPSGRPVEASGEP